MKQQNLLVLLMILILTPVSFAQTPNKVICTETVFIYEQLPFLKESSTLQELSHRKDLVVGHPTPEGFEVYGDSNLYATLDALKISYTRINFTKKDSLSLKSHPSFFEVEDKLHDITSYYSDIMTIENIGDSVEGRPLWMVRIEDEGLGHYEKKHVLYIANIHGNEITGREIMMLFIEEIGQLHTMGDFEITDLLETTVIHILPSMNPDGAEIRRRSNANFVDLNREFPDWTESEPNTMDQREPEVQAVMSYYQRYEFSFSVNFHGGEEVINYPWDASPEPGPMEYLLEEVSLEYIANGAQYMQSSYFPSGVTRGYDWYPVYGGLQDWSTHYHDSPHLTIELSDDKWPHFDEMEYYYEQNRNSMIKAMSFF